jgi:tetratricopeptide (TPR) repeat protein
MAIPPPPPAAPKDAPPPAPPAPPRDTVEGRIAALRAEIEADPDKARQAALTYEIGLLYERRVGNDALAVREYLRAFTLEPGFRLPLFALTRIFERRRAFRNLGRLYEAEAKAASTPADRASALLDRAVLGEDHLGEVGAARAFYEEALETDPSHLAASLMFERYLGRLGDRPGAAATAAARAAHVRDPALRAALLVEAARARDAEGDVEGAFASLREAAELPVARFRTYEAMERLARRRDRVPELVEALEARAVLAASEARGEDQGQGSGAFAVQRFADEHRALLEAAALWREAARLRLVRLGDAPGAVQGYVQALALRPDDVLLRQECMHACELAGDLDGAAEQARALLALASDGPVAAGLHFRLAEAALASGDREGARTALSSALTADPSSVAAAAVLEDLDADDGRHGERIARLEAVVGDATRPPDVRAFAALRAAIVASDEMGDFGKAAPLFTAAVALAAEATRGSEGVSQAGAAVLDVGTVLREQAAAARRAGDAAVAVEALTALLAMPLDPAERAAIVRERWLLVRDALAQPEAAAALLAEAAGDEAAASWAIDAARVHAALAGDRALLALAHEQLAARSASAEAAVAHLCMAARARVRGGDAVGAEKLLREALDRVPGHRYAVALLEEILRAKGEAEEVVELLRQAAVSQQGARAAETALLLAGAAAQAAGDVALAARTYEEAAERDPESVSPLYALAHLAERAGDRALLLRAREALAAREFAAGVPGRAALELGEHLALHEKRGIDAEAPLRSALDDAAVGPFAATMLAFLPHLASDPETRALAVERLRRAAGDAPVPALARELGGIALGGQRDPARAAAMAAEVLRSVPDDRWALYARLRTASQPSERVDALRALANATSDAAAAKDLALHALRARIVAEGASALDDAVLSASELADAASGELIGAVALDETLGPADDPETRAHALAARLAHAGATPPLSLLSALGRQQLAAGLVEDAVATLSAVLERDPEDLAAWDALRVAAREAERWDLVVRAADTLAERTEGELAAQLYEEAAAVLMDHGEDADAEAETRLAKALAIGPPNRPIAYGRMHDLLAARGDAEALSALVQRCIDATDDEADLVKLFYEQARIRRSLGDIEGAIGALENLLMLEADHVGGLALMVEVCVAQGRFEGAVDALRSLAEADVPAAQKRIARLGAADLLESKLGDVDAALAEIGALVGAGLADAAVHAKAADIAERAGRFDEAAEALGRAADASSGERRAAFEKRAAALHRDRRIDPASAVVALRRALEAVPLDLEAAEALADLLAGEARAAHGADFERIVREALASDPTEPALLRRLRRAASWRGDVQLEHAVLLLLAALDVADSEERAALTAVRPTQAPRGTLSEDRLARLRPSGAQNVALQVFAAVAETLVELDGLEPAKFGVGRGDRVGPRDPSPVRDELLASAAAFGLPAGDVYVGGRDPSSILGLPREGDPPVWVVGTGVAAPLSPARRFTVGRTAMALRLGVAPLLGRPVVEWVRLAVAASVAVEAPLPSAHGMQGVDEWARALGKAMPRRVRKALPDLLRALGDGRDLDAAARAARRTTLRAGLLLAGDPAAALEAVLGRGVSRDAVQDDGDALDLVSFWLSPDALAARREMGLG